jgi:type VI secretion system protein ImpK
VAQPAAPLPATGANPLIAAASPLLAAAVRIAGGRGRNPDPEQLRRAMVEGVREFERRALATGLDTRSLRAARYALCATLDDIVLSTPWGAASAWPAQSLTSIFHNEVSGGERFFDILDQMQKDLGHHQAVVELMYLCMTLGFEGRYRVMPRGVAALTDLRDSVYRGLRQRRGEFERELSPHWKGLPLPASRLSGFVPLWAVGLGTAMLACVIYAGFNFALASRSDVAFAELFGLPPKGPIAVARAEPAPPPPPSPPPAQIASLSSKLHSFLAPEIREGLVTVLEDAQTVTVRLTNRNMFASGQATLNPASQPLLNRIGDALREERGDIVVNGYTDNQPIHSVRFPSNFELSQARADAVGALVKARLADPNRLKTAGHADADPIAPNTSPEGRQANRRTEIVLIRTGGAA